MAIPRVTSGAVTPGAVTSGVRAAAIAPRNPVVAGARSEAPLLALILSAGLLTANAVSQGVYLTAGWQQVGLMVLATSVLSLCLVASQFRQRVWAFPPMLLLLIVLFHVGLLLGPAVTGDFYLLSGASTDWVYTAQTRQAAWFVSSCVAAFAAGVHLTRILQGPEDSVRIEDDRFSEVVSAFGTVVLLTSIASWFALVLYLLGPSAFSGSYLDFFDATRTSAISYANLGISLGLGLVCVRPRGRWARTSLVVFAVFALASMSIGARSTVMFSAAAGAVVMAHSHAMPRMRWLGLIIAAVASLLGVVRLTRLSGTSALGLDTFLRAPATGFAELGYTVRVVQTSFVWHDVRHEPLSHGATYTGWLARLVDAYVLNIPVPLEDYRLMNVEIGSRIGGLGGSMLGEAHHNFGAVGGIALLFALGALTTAASRAVRTTLAVAVLAVIAGPLLIHVRNAFTPVLFAVLCGLCLVQLARLVARRRGG